MPRVNWRCPQDMLRKAGFFHFGNRCDDADPIGSLRASLAVASGQNNLGECLVVTPEAFNIRNDYWIPERRHLDVSIKKSLGELSREFEVAFVAGLIEDGVGRDLG